MKKASITEVKNKLSEYLQLVRRGAKVRIYDRNQPIAEIVPIQELAASTDDLGLEELEKQGVLRRGSGKVPQEIFQDPPPRLEAEAGSVLETLIQDRRRR